MIVYRIDRYSILKENQIIKLEENVKLQNVFDLYNNSFSNHGINYLNDYSDASIYELCLEFIRINYFPHFPSRLQCVFGTKTLEDAKKWMNILPNQSTSPMKIYKIECEKAYEFDASWITYPPSIPNKDYNFNPRSIAKILELCYKYWSQEKTSNPLLELLIKLPAKVIKVL